MAKKQPEPKVQAPSVAVIEYLRISINSDAEIFNDVPRLSEKCKFLEFTSSPKCRSMEDWQRLFEQNKFRFVRDLMTPTIRTQLYESTYHAAH